MYKIWFLRFLRLFIAIVFFQTLFFKFSGAEESVFIFSMLGVEPWGRIGAGITELIVVFLMIFPKTVGLGALMGLGTMAGALLTHIFVIGINVKNDDGLLFFLALICFFSSGILLYFEKINLLNVVNSILQRKNK